MTLDERIEAFTSLRDALNPSKERSAMSTIAIQSNLWFTIENINQSIGAIQDEFLDHIKLNKWIEKYTFEKLHPKKIALVLAGNIPAVGFHDILCVLIAGHRVQIKLSSKDKIIIPYILDRLIEIDNRFLLQIDYVERVSDFDAIIATGSNNSAVHFAHYFSKYPHIIRRNRKSIGIISKDWKETEIISLGDDILTHFGLGCRNVSFLWIHQDVDLEPLMEIWHRRKEFILHNKYKNNYDYNYTLLLMNGADFLMNSCLLLVNENTMHSRIATVNYQRYKDEKQISTYFSQNNEDIQCVVSSSKMDQIPTIYPGLAQIPSLSDYADNVDTMSFLTSNI